MYLSDSGVLHSLLGISSRHELLGHPKVGASWEGFALQQIIERLGAKPRECFFWALHTGAELDLLIVQGNQRRGFEIKLTDSPKATPSMYSAIENLRLSAPFAIGCRPRRRRHLSAGQANPRSSAPRALGEKSRAVIRL